MTAARRRGGGIGDAQIADQQRDYGGGDERLPADGIRRRGDWLQRRRWAEASGAASS
ncbi:MAG: hypothetical protein ACLS6G_04110 [Christensenellales bacterium]